MNSVLSIKLNLARNCLRYIIKAYKIKELFIPFYICPSVIKAVRSENCNIRFYHINSNFYPEQTFDKSAFILYPNYFGICANNVRKLELQYKNLIVDNAHNAHIKNCGLASFNSLRKFFKVADGAELYIQKILPDNFQADEYRYIDSPKNYKEIQANEKRLDNEEIKILSNCTESHLFNINRKKDRIERLKNFELLHLKYKKTNELNINLTEEDVPFVYPYLTHNEDLGQELEQKGLLIFRYWNVLPETMPEYEFYRYLIPIPLL